VDVTHEEPRRKFTADEIQAMVRAGILGEDDKLELIEGELLIMSPQDPPHAGIVGGLTARLVHAYGRGFVVRVQLPLLASVESMPEPDFAVVRGDERDYQSRHPGGTDCALVVEVTWTTRRRDERKAAIYAKAGVPAYFRIDLESRELIVREHPAPDGTWRAIRTLREGEDVELPESNGVRLQVVDLLPAR
jgi:hypothetical protein